MPLVTLADVQAARARVSSRVRRTPLVRSTHIGRMLGVDLYFKLESTQETGSFKVRGALNRIDALTDDEKRRGVVTLSAGNHAQAVSWAARAAGVRATCVMPAVAVKSKLEATRGYGGEVIQSADMLVTVEEVRRERNLTLVHPFDDPMVIAGAGTVAEEIIDEIPDLDAIVCGVGGGGLVAGTAVVVRARRPASRIIGIEPDGASSMRQSLEQGRAVRLPSRPTTVADGLAAPYAGDVTFPHVRDLGVEVYTVPDTAIVDAMWLLMERAKVFAEPAAAAGIAGLLAKLPAPSLAPGSKVACIISGGNVDRERLRSIA